MIEFDKFKQEIHSGSIIGIICHKNPDADAIGSMLGLKYILETFGKQVEVICVDELDNVNKLIFGEVEIRSEVQKGIDVLIFVDCSCLEVSGIGNASLGRVKTISIDHHASHNWFADFNIVWEVSSTCEIIFDMIKYFNLELNSEVAKWLLAGISFDTGGLKHDNTTAKVYRIVKELVEARANLEKLNNILFRSCTARDLRMYGRIFRMAKVNRNGVLSCIISRDEINDLSCSEFEVKKAIDYLNQIQDIKMSLLGFEQNEKTVKFSLRSNNDNYDVSKIAQLFEGGGHKKAAGFRVEV
jgi:phosphoesterase RecJ-like protein